MAIMAGEDRAESAGGNPLRIAPPTGYQPPEQLRRLSEIFCELGHTLLARGNNLRVDGQPDQAKRVYAEAAQAFRDAIREEPDAPELHR
jgi:hypothetical protein